MLEGSPHTNNEKQPLTKGASTYFWQYNLGQNEITTSNTGDFFFLKKTQHIMIIIIKSPQFKCVIHVSVHLVAA